MSEDNNGLPDLRLTFFTKTADKSKLRDEDMARRKIITAMLLANESLSALKITALAGTGKGNTYDTIQEFVRAGLAKSETKATYQNIKHHLYSLTDRGRNIAIAIGHKTHELPVSVYSKNLRKTFQPDPDDDAVTTLYNHAYLNALDRGLTEVCMIVNYEVARSRESNQEMIDYRRLMLNLMWTPVLENAFCV